MSVYVKPLLTSSVPKVDIECPLFSFDFDAHLCSTVEEVPNIGEDIYVNLICAGLFSKAPSPSNGDYFL